MNDDDKLLWMFNQVHGYLSLSCHAEIDFDEEGNALGVNVIKDGSVCWRVSKVDLLFGYITKDLLEEEE